MQGDGFDRARAILEPFRFGFAKVAVAIATFDGPGIFSEIDPEVYSKPDRELQDRVYSAVLAIARRNLPASATELEREGWGVSLASKEAFFDRYVLAEKRADIVLLKTVAMYAGSELPLPQNKIYWTNPDVSLTDDWQCDYALRWYLKLLDDERFEQRPPDDFGQSVNVRVCDDTFAASWIVLNELLRPATLERQPEPQDDDELEIINLIGSIGHRLTTTQLLSEFEKRGHIKAESTIKQKLARMVTAGLLTNRQDVRPHKGYGLTSWD